MNQVTQLLATVIAGMVAFFTTREKDPEIERLKQERKTERMRLRQNRKSNQQ